MMTPQDVQDAMAAELAALFADDIAKDQSGTAKAPHIFTQELPDPSETEEKPGDRCPYVQIIVGNGKNPEGDAATVAVTLIFCICDDDKSKQGHRVILHMIQLVAERFGKTPLLKPAAIRTGEMEWTLPDDQPMPLYLGGMALTFSIPGFVKEDPLT